MINLLIDYSLDSLNVTNPDGTLPATVSDCKVVPGPGVTSLGDFINALDFSASGKVLSTLPVASVNASKFCLRTLFKIDSAVSAKQILVESDTLPFSLFIDSSTAGDFKLCVSINNSISGSAIVSTENFLNLVKGTWYTAELAFDIDTLALYVNGSVVSVHAFPAGNIIRTASQGLYIGIAKDGVSNGFKGAMACVKFYDGIPEELEALLDERRTHPEWFISYKYESIKFLIVPGAASGTYAYDPFSDSYYQRYVNNVLIMYHEGNGVAFEMHGKILEYYDSYSSKSELGYLVTDESNAASADSKKSLFSRGGIYWTRLLGAHAVLGYIYTHYESLGEATFCGLPTSEESDVSQGKQQVFQRANIYLKDNTTQAFEVHGNILQKFLSSGGINTWGFPVSNEEDILVNGHVAGRLSDFEHCTIYWSSQTGAHEVHGDIRKKYRDIKGPSSNLGLPTSDEGDIPGAAGTARYNTFQNGSILWFGSASRMFVSEPFNLYIGRLDTVEQEGWLKGSNDIYCYVKIYDNGSLIYNERWPHSGDSNDNNILDISQQLNIAAGKITPNSTSRNIKLYIDVWESDWPDGDEHLGVFEKTLSMANAWGFKEQASGLFNSGAFEYINNISWSVRPYVNESTLLLKNRWWSVSNRGTDEIDYNTYAAAFNNVDTESEWWDIPDWLDKAFYSLVIDDLAKKGNCFGMSLEGIYAKKHRSLFSLPIDRFTNWNDLVKEFNIKHQYQVGAPAIWWFVGQFLTGNTHDPVDVFRATRAEFDRGSDPVLCISQNYDFGGAPHCILPIEWDDSSKPWKIKVHDPNFPSSPSSDVDPGRYIEINPDRNTFTYNGSSNYSGGEWSGGRLHYMPFCVLNSRPRTPVWDAILLLLAGTIIVLGDSAETISLTDANGIDLNAFGVDAVNKRRSNRNVSDKFVPMHGFHNPDGISMAGLNIISPVALQSVAGLAVKPIGIKAGKEIYMHYQRFKAYRGRDLSVLPGSISGTLLKDIIKVKGMDVLIRDPKVMDVNKNRTMLNLLNDDGFKKSIGKDTTKSIETVIDAAATGKNFIHNYMGSTGGTLDYLVKSKLNSVMIQSDIGIGERNKVEVKDLGTAASIMNLNAGRDKTVKVIVHNQLGLGKDYLKMTINNVPVKIAQELSMNIKPGLGGIEMMIGSDQLNGDVNIEAHINGRKMSSKFGLNETGGIRITPSTMITNNEIKVSKIDSIFGTPRTSKFILGK